MAIDPLTAMVVGGLGNAFLQQALAPGAPKFPTGPAVAPPMWGPVQQYTKFNDWQYNNRLNMLRDFYGGRITRDQMRVPKEPRINMSGERGPILDEAWGDWEGSSFNWFDDFKNKYVNGEGNSPGTQRHLEFGGGKPARQWKQSQMQPLRSSEANFAGDVGNYLAQRGLASEPAVAGAVDEQKKDYDQLKREILSNAQNIRMNTLGQLFGEVSDAAAGTGNMAAQVMSQQQAQQQQANQRYNQLMQMWQAQQANQQPGFLNVIGGLAGQMLPYYLQGMGGSPAGSMPPYVDNTRAYKAQPAEFYG